MCSSPRDRGRRWSFPRISTADVSTTSFIPAGKALRLSFELGKGLVRDDHGQADHRGGGLVMIELEVLFEDNHCLAVNKPAGLLSQGDRSGEPSLVDVAATYLKTRYAKPGNVYVGLLHRLDRPASGVMLLAKTSKAAARLSEQFRPGRSPSSTGRSWRGLRPEDGHLVRRARQGQRS